MNRARAETCSVEEKYMTEKLLRSLLKRSENIKTSSFLGIHVLSPSSKRFLEEEFLGIIGFRNPNEGESYECECGESKDHFWQVRPDTVVVAVLKNTFFGNLYFSCQIVLRLILGKPRYKKKVKKGGFFPFQRPPPP